MKYDHLLIEGQGYQHDHNHHQQERAGNHLLIEGQGASHDGGKEVSLLPDKDESENV